MAVTYTDRDTMVRGDVLRSFRWQAVVAGVIAALATQVLLSTIGGALGLSATAIAENEDAARGLGIGAGVWFVISPLISMFVGGAVAGYLARPLDRTVAKLHGAMVWAISLIIGAFIVGSIASQAVGGIVGTGLDTAGKTVANATVTDKNQRDELSRDVKEKKVEAKARIDRNREEIAETADKAANAGTTAAWASVFAMVLSLLSAMGGAMMMHGQIYGPTKMKTRRETTTTHVDTGVTVSHPTTRTLERDETYRPDLH